MRIIIRMLVFWAITAPLFYVFGLPYLMDMMSKKAQTQAYDQCKTHLTSEGLIGSANSPLTAELGETYCHCLSDPLQFTQNDLMDVVKKQPPAALTAQAEGLAKRCNEDLQRAQGFLPAQ